jgi:hypothetical protein
MAPLLLAHTYRISEDNNFSVDFSGKRRTIPIRLHIVTDLKTENFNFVRKSDLTF